MRCPSCGTKIWDNDRFCQQCGAPLKQGELPENLIENSSPTEFMGDSVTADNCEFRLTAFFHNQSVNLGPRVYAHAIDLIFCTLLILASGPVLVVAGGELANGRLLVQGLFSDGPHPCLVRAWYQATYGVLLFYFIFTEGLFGMTLGKRMLGMKIITKRGKTPGPLRTFLRTMLRIPDLVCGLFMIPLIPTHRRLGDYLSGTYVVKREEDKKS